MMNIMFRPRNDPYPAQGFTLLELLFSILLLSILLSVIFPSFRTLHQSSMLKGAGDTLYTDLAYARSEATKRGTSVYVNINTTSNWCYGIKVGSACDCSVANSCQIGNTTRVVNHTSYPKAQLSSSLPSANLIFEGVRGMASNSGTLTLSNGSQTANVVINPTGYIQVCSSNIAGYPSC